MKLIACLCLLISVGGTTRSAIAQSVVGGKDIAIVYVESIVPARSSSGAGGTQKSTASNLTFDAYGRRFELQLERNDRIAPATLAKPATADSLQLLRGAIASVPGSWVRLASRSDGRMSGMIWDGLQLFLIEPAATVRDSLLPPLVAGDNETLIFRMADTLISPEVAICEAPALVAGKPATGQDAYDSMIHELRAGMKGGAVGLQAAGAALRLEMSIVGDPAFRAQYASDEQARNEILIRMNNVDGIYSSQLGVAIQVPVVKVDAATTQALTTSTSSSTLLDSMGDVRRDSAELRSKGLTHLFTGRDLDGATVGVAFRDALCRNQGASARFGVGLTEARRRGAWFESLIAAHEIGHNFGAVHDGDAPDTGQPDCSGTPVGAYLMSPSVNADNSLFSACSLSTIRPRIQAASCITALPPPDLAVAADLGTVTQNLSSSFDIVIPVTNIGGVTSTGSLASVLVPPSIVVEDVYVTGGSCTSGAGVIKCQIGDIAGGARSDIHLTLRGDALGSNSISVQVTADSDSQANNNSGDGTLIIDGEANLNISMAVTNPVVAGSNFIASYTITNPSAVAVNNLNIDIELPSFIAGSAATLGGQPCAMDNPMLFHCVLPTLPAKGSSSGSVNLVATVSGEAAIRARITGASFDPYDADNFAERIVTVTPAPASVASPVRRSGGGGSAGIALLMTLALAGAVRQQLRQRDWASRV